MGRCIGERPKEHARRQLTTERETMVTKTREGKSSEMTRNTRGTCAATLGGLKKRKNPARNRDVVRLPAARSNQNRENSEIGCNGASERAVHRVRCTCILVELQREAFVWSRCSSVGGKM
ncbi:acetyl-CoA acetyltransferase [Anopheles sinensis]|uniref:Acetyl-CoA acetyltransferase n=1 Tax=Anopheles sinensis TaxID=74873 RepID=A0A084W6M5_ANOSI|nr:acetyl-CoA acetyltransferase [Anopheles sinensis]